METILTITILLIIFVPAPFSNLFNKLISIFKTNERAVHPDSLKTSFYSISNRKDF
tara:strand:- start:1522 stop:1689 length:168 start_codon:yes stop_codon:yes gene_type:complete